MGLHGVKKYCSKCEAEKNSTDFRKDTSRPDGLYYMCKLCARAKTKMVYHEKYADKANERNRNRISLHKQRINELKETLKCALCDEDNSACLDFHHLDPTTKEFGIGGRLHVSWERVLLEVQKCICICSNCHRKLHAGYISLLPS